MSRVAVVRCSSYSRGEVEGAIYRLLSYLPDLQPPSRLLVKPNLISPVEPDRAVTTHPEVIRAIVRYFKDKVSDIVIADNPGFIFDGQEDELFVRTGVKDVADAEGIRYALLRSSGMESIRMDGKHLKEIVLSKMVGEVGFIVNVAKMKTHVDTLITGAVKNIFGTVASGTRRTAHMLGSRKMLAESIVDIYKVVMPQLSVMDAVVGMEGNGPSHGSPKKVGYLLASADGVALDVVASYIMGFDPKEVDTITYADAIGVGKGRLDEIEIVGDSIDVVPFKRPDSWKLKMSGIIGAIGYRLVRIYPSLDKSSCVKCGVCAGACPAEAIKMQPYPVIDRNRCIYCFTCNEVCPTGAMEIKKSLAARVLGY